MHPVLQPGRCVFVRESATGGRGQWQPVCCLAASQQCSFSIKLKQSSGVTHSAAGQSSKLSGDQTTMPSAKLVARFRRRY